MRSTVRTAVLASGLALLSATAAAQDRNGWYVLDVPGGRATLRDLGVADTRERAAVMVELIRRLQFSTTAQTELETALRRVPVSGQETLTLPSPLAPDAWSRLVFGRTVPASRLFAEILSDLRARLLFHGLAGLDAPTRQWIAGEPDLLRRLARSPDALKSFALFAPAVRVAYGRVVVPGPSVGEQRWSAVLSTKPDQPARFVSRLFDHDRGRTAGLYATIAFVDAPRQTFLLSPSEGRFRRLVSAFASCYPDHANDYPFALRSQDAGLLLLDVDLNQAGIPPGPRSQRFWQSTLDAGDLTQPPAGLADADEIDAAWIVDRLCAASATDRPGVFATLLAGHRSFANLPRDKWPDAVLALRVRRLFPSVFMAIERAGIADPGVFAVVGRHVAKLDRLNDMEGAAIALRQFQGALAMTLQAVAAGTFNTQDAARLLASLSAVPFEDQRYDGRIADWIEREWLPSIRKALSALDPSATAEQLVAQALAGPSPSSPAHVQWEGLEYVVDFPAATRDRLRDVRARQGGATLDQVLALKQSARGSARVRTSDAQLAQVLASWAYAPHVGAADGGALVGGDSSSRHDLGLRSVNRTRFQQRWEVAVMAGDRGSIAGSFLGLEAALANWSLRRLASDTIPPPPTIGGNDLTSLLLTVALSDPRRLADAGMHQIVQSIADGSRLLARARSDSARLMELGRLAGISPWRSEALPWMLREEPDRIDEQFSLAVRAHLGGLKAPDAAAWGPASLAAGCLCLRMPPARIPELVLGRPADGIVGSQSADLMLRIAMILVELKLPAPLASPVLAYAMRDFLDAVRPQHPADFDAYSRPARAFGRAIVEDYLGAIAAVGALRPVPQ